MSLAITHDEGRRLLAAETVTSLTQHLPKHRSNARIRGNFGLGHPGQHERDRENPGEPHGHRAPHGSFLRSNDFSVSSEHT
jgi:hypothetical protein